MKAAVLVWVPLLESDLQQSISAKVECFWAYAYVSEDI